MSTSIYLSEDGKQHALLELTGEGVLPPPSLWLTRALVRGGNLQLWYCGETYDLFATLANHHKARTGRKANSQAWLADLAGVSQQSISRYINGQSDPQTLTDTAWSAIGHAYRQLVTAAA